MHRAKARPLQKSKAEQKQIPPLRRDEKRRDFGRDDSALSVRADQTR